MGGRCRAGLEQVADEPAPGFGCGVGGGGQHAGVGHEEHGTIIFTTGGTSAKPGMLPDFASIAIGAGALRTYALSLHAAVAGQGVHVAHVPLSTWIGKGGPETQPDTIAEHYWSIYTSHEGAEHPYVALS